MRNLLPLFIALHVVVANGAPCSDALLKGVRFEFPPEKTDCVSFKVEKTAKELRGQLTNEEETDFRHDKEIWDRLKIQDSKVAPKGSDIAIYPASGVDFGLPINVMSGAGLYVGVDIEKTPSNEQIQAWAKDPKFDISKLFSEKKYLKTIPLMVTGSAGEGAKFANSYLKNLVTSLPDDAVIESVNFVEDHQAIAWRGRTQKWGPHVLVKWRQGKKQQSALLISAPMLTPKEGKGVWWYDELERLKPAYSVMKRPAGFSFDDVYSHLCGWVLRRGGMILAEGDPGNYGGDVKTQACFDSAERIDHTVTARDVKRDEAILGFSRSAVLMEIMGMKAGGGDSAKEHK